jgi:hypothetical protein
MGSYHEEFKVQLADYLKADNLELFVNGHMALELGIQALKLEGEVITTPFTFASTTHAIVRNGLTPVFCDINEQDYTMDADKIESLITELRGNLQGQLLNIPFNTPACINCKHCNPATDESEPILKCDLPGGPRPIREHTLTCNKFKLRDNLKKKQEAFEEEFSREVFKK